MIDRTYIGLDVHAQTVAACALNPATGQIRRGTMNHDPYTVLSWVQQFGDDTEVVYESGPTGFGLARYLLARDVRCVIAASSKLLKAPGDHVKNDKRDAMTLARILSLGQITEVWIPTEEQEALRDLSRARQQTARMLAKSRQQVNALLLRHGIFYQERTKWTLRHKAWLHRQQLGQLEAQLSLEADLELAETLEGHLKRLEARIKDIAAECQYTQVINALMCFRGIDLTTGFGLAAEIGDWTRFSAKSIGAYLGLVPSEHSSGASRSQGPVTKSGNTFARKMLIEASWQHAKPYKRPGIRLVRQFDLVAPETRMRAIEGNHRLHRVWANFDQRGKKRTKANTAVARELASWLWSVAAPLQEQTSRGPAYSKENTRVA